MNIGWDWRGLPEYHHQRCKVRFTRLVIDANASGESSLRYVLAAQEHQQLEHFLAHTIDVRHTCNRNSKPECHNGKLLSHIDKNPSEPAVTSFQHIGCGTYFPPLNLGFDWDPD